MKTSVFIAASMDGYIARKDGGLDWLDMVASEGEDYGYGAFMDTVDALVMGRVSYEKVLSFGHWPYDKPAVVLSGRSLEVPGSLRGRVESMNAAPREVVERLAARGVGHVYLDGGRTIQGFLAAGLVDRMTISRIPVLLGEGIPLFGALPGDVRLRHNATRSYPSGLVQSDYEIVR